MLPPSLVAQMVKNLPPMQETGAPSLGREIPWRREWLLTPVFLPEGSHGQRSLASTVHVVTKSQTRLSNSLTHTQTHTDTHTHTHTHTHTIALLGHGAWEGRFISQPPNGAALSDVCLQAHVLLDPYPGHIRPCHVMGPVT